MTDYLHLAVGGYDLLLGAEPVLEVLDEAPAAGAHGRCVWRGATLPMLDLRQRLALEPRPGGMMVVQGDGSGRPERALRLDRVVGLRRYEETAFLPLPPLVPAFAALFDKAVSDNERFLLRCRADLG